MLAFKQTIIIPLASFILLALFSFSFGWNIFSLFLFWFVLIPVVASFLPIVFSKSEDYLHRSIIGLSIFYAFMVLMIYEHFQSDYFMIMIISLFCNIAAVAGITWMRKNVR